jgi:hypothetical protein
MTVVVVHFATGAAQAFRRFRFFFLNLTGDLAIDAAAVRTFGMGQIAKRPDPADADLIAVSADHTHARRSTGRRFNQSALMRQGRSATRIPAGRAKVPRTWADLISSTCSSIRDFTMGWLMLLS